MKTETQIAKEHLEFYNSKIPKDERDFTDGQMQEHKQSCQRFLDFLEEQRMELKDKGLTWLDFKQKIVDLKIAIKLYEANGI